MKSLLFLISISLLFISSNCSFQLSLFNELNKLKNGQNVIISPLSIYQVLSLASNGATGVTRKEMVDALQSDSLSSLNSKNYELLSITKNFTTVEVANAVMTRFTPLSTFQIVAKKYCASVEPLKSVSQVNEWCNQNTHGKIKKILNELDPNVQMILLNAVYFKGEWTNEFTKYNTRKRVFYNLGKTEVEVDTMRQTRKFNYYEDSNVQAVELPYKKDNMSALIILPRENVEINNYINSLAKSENDLQSIVKGLNNEFKVDLQLPKFELEFQSSFVNVLKNQGMVTSFNKDIADFSGLIKKAKLYISDVIQKTYLKVDEKGTEAAAVTAVSVKNGARIIKEKIIKMDVNRPFLFLIRSSKLPANYDNLFMAKIEKITQK